MSYRRFVAMVVASTVLMYGLMYLNTYSIDHLFFSQTRMWMAVVMGAAMALTMLSFMWRMYPKRHLNMIVAGFSILVFCSALWLVRSQATVDDVSYMKAMIPHHSIAVMTSERAHIRDPRVRQLADGILRTQVTEIREMERLIVDLQRNPVGRDAPDIPALAIGK